MKLTRLHAVAENNFLIFVVVKSRADENCQCYDINGECVPNVLFKIVCLVDSPRLRSRRNHSITGLP